MSIEKAKQFLKEYKYNEEIAKILEQYPKPRSSDEATAQLIEAVGKLGIGITEEDIAKAVQELKEEQKAKTDAAADDLQALDDDDLEEAAGGVYYYVNGENGRKRIYACFEDHVEGETCSLEDACKYAQVRYYDCNGEGKFYKEGEEKGCTLYDIMCDSSLIK